MNQFCPFGFVCCRGTNDPIVTQFFLQFVLNICIDFLFRKELLMLTSQYVYLYCEVFSIEIEKRKKFWTVDLLKFDIKKKNTGNVSKSMFDH